jgi:hypothetical protein
MPVPTSNVTVAPKGSVGCPWQEGAPASTDPSVVPPSWIELDPPLALEPLPLPELEVPLLPAALDALVELDAVPLL